MLGLVGLVGLVHDEIGAIPHPGDRRHAATVLTRSRPGADDAATAWPSSVAVSAAIGTAAALAVDVPRSPSA